MALAEIKYRHELELKELAAKYDGIVAAQYRAQENMYNLQLQQVPILSFPSRLFVFNKKISISSIFRNFLNKKMI